MTTEVMTTPTWMSTEKPIRLKFVLGGVLLGAAETRAAVWYEQPVEERLPRVTLEGGVLRYVPRQYRKFHIDLEGTFEGYLKRFGSQTRRWVTRWARKLARENGGKVEWRVYRRPEEMGKFYRLGREVSRKSYQERLLEAGLPEGEEFRRELEARAAADGVRGYILFLQGRPAAYGYCYAEGDVLMYEKTGFDPAYQQSRPGRVLLYHMLESLFAERRFRKLDLGRGESAYKELYATGYVQCADVYYFRVGWRSLSLVGLHSALALTSRAGSRALERVKLKERLQNLLRFGAPGKPTEENL